MNTRIAASLVGLSTLIAAPAFARSDAVERCIDSFIAQNYPGANVKRVVETQGVAESPLQFWGGTVKVQVVATEADGSTHGAMCYARERETRVGEIGVSDVNDQP